MAPPSRGSAVRHGAAKPRSDCSARPYVDNVMTTLRGPFHRPPYGVVLGPMLASNVATGWMQCRALGFPWWWSLYAGDQQVKPVQWAAIQNSRFHDSHVKDMHSEEDAHVRYNCLFSLPRVPWTSEISFCRTFWGRFAKLQKATFSSVVSGRPHAAAVLSRDALLWDLIFEHFPKSVEKIEV